VFLKKFYPIHKTALIRKSITQFKQEPNEPFWKYFDRFKNLLALCPRHGIESGDSVKFSMTVLITRPKSSLRMCHGELLKEDEDQG